LQAHLYNQLMETIEELVPLGDIPLFKLLDDQERADLARVFERRTYSTGDVIFNFGEPGDSLYIVRSGKVELLIRDTTGSKIVLTVADTNDLFGELSLFDGGARTATALVLEDAEVLVLDRDDLLSFLRSHPDAALDFLAMMGQRIRATDEMLRAKAARNINIEMEVNSTWFEKAADVIAEFSGSMTFLLLNVIWFVVWIGWNVIPGLEHFDPYPFGFLTMTVSLEAIFLSIFVLISQNRQSEKDRLRADAEYQVNLKAELEVAHLHEKVDFLTEELLRRMPGPDRRKTIAR
jgi:CRP/FNR family transcriptional regulator, cyclic AMP receptor protein